MSRAGMTGVDRLAGRPLPGLADYALLTALASVWGSSFIFIKIAAAEVSPLAMAAARLAIAGLILLAIAAAFGQKIRFRGRTLGLLFVVGIFGSVIPFTLIAWGQQTVDAGLAAVLTGIGPIVTLVVAHFLAEGEPLTARKLAGVMIGFVGLIVLVGPAVLLRFSADGVSQIAILIGAASYAVATVLTKGLLGEPRLAAAAGLMLTGALIMVPISLVLDSTTLFAASMPAIASIVILAIIPSAFAQLVIFKLIDRQGAGFFGQVNLLVPPFGILWAGIFLDEVPGPATFAALALILAGIWFTRGRQAPAVADPVATEGEDVR